jgi:uncharacterized coiled-coil protein SlyX
VAREEGTIKGRLDRIIVLLEGLIHTKAQNGTPAPDVAPTLASSYEKQIRLEFDALKAEVEQLKSDTAENNVIDAANNFIGPVRENVQKLDGRVTTLETLLSETLIGTLGRIVAAVEKPTSVDRAALDQLRQDLRNEFAAATSSIDENAIQKLLEKFGQDFDQKLRDLEGKVSATQADAATAKSDAAAAKTAATEAKEEVGKGRVTQRDRRIIAGIGILAIIALALVSLLGIYLWSRPVLVANTADISPLVARVTNLEKSNTGLQNRVAALETQLAARGANPASAPSVGTTAPADATTAEKLRQYENRIRQLEIWTHQAHTDDVQNKQAAIPERGSWPSFLWPFGR